MSVHDRIARWVILHAPPASKRYEFGEAILPVDVPYVFILHFQSWSDNLDFPGIRKEQSADGVKPTENSGETGVTLTFSNIIMTVDEYAQLKALWCLSKTLAYEGGTIPSRGTFRMNFKLNQQQVVAEDRYYKTYSVRSDGIGVNSLAGTRNIFVSVVNINGTQSHENQNKIIVNVKLEIVSPPPGMTHADY